MADWIDQFLAYTATEPSPKIFRLWAGITAISGALDRRVWINAGLGPLYPNLYTMLVGPPGSGKTKAISPVKELWMENSRELHVAPDNLTHAALIDSLAKNNRFLIGEDYPNGMYEIHSVLVPTPELGVLISKHDLDFLSILNHIFDSPPNYREERRSMEGKNPDITNPQLTILAGTQPDFLANMLPEEAWGMGFCSRLMLVYAAESPELELFAESTVSQSHLYPELSERLSKMVHLYGEMRWTKGAKLCLKLWHKHKMPPVPDYHKLVHYNARRLQQALKLITISAVSRCGNLIIEEEDVERVKEWMREAEAVMPDIFRSMLAKSDAEILSELHQYVWRVWASVVPENRKPVPEVEIYGFLKDRVPSEKIDKILDVAVKSGLLQVPQYPGGGWVPRPLPGLGQKDG